uniref:Acetyl-coenzyme A synthetase N-terminal domain-containing protein n=1 Tax=Plectus sambesii TaxID=2011161 RepID=A0A914WNE0_9BILA
MRFYPCVRLIKNPVFTFTSGRLESTIATHHGSKIRFAPLTESLPEISALDKSLTNRDAIYRYSLDQSDKFWATLARSRLDWYSDFHTVQNCDMAKGQFEWFSGGKLNASVNCVDRHAKADPNRVALIWERDEAGTEVKITY